MLIIWRARTGTAAHPSSVALLCSLPQVPETVEIVRRLEMGVAAGEDRSKDSTIKLGWIGTGRRAENYGLVVLRAG